METKRLKNIAILLLVLLNAALLALLGFQRLQSRRTEQATVEALNRLFAAESLSLDPSVNPLQDSLTPLTLSRDTGTEARIAAYLLGEEVPAVSQGGGIDHYAGTGGTVLFRSGGSFSAAGLTVTSDDPAAFVRDFCGSFGYQDLSFTTEITNEGLLQTATALQYLSGVPVLGCSLTVQFLDEQLTQVSGTHVSLENAVVEGGGMLDSATALARFLDYRRRSGVVCRQVDSVECVYTLATASPSPRLVPLWRIEADTSPYLVDAATGEVSRG